MVLMERYQKAVDDLFAKVRATQTEKIQEAGELIANAVMNGGKIILNGICHSIEGDLTNRGGGPVFYRRFNYKFEVEKNGRKRDRSDLDTNMEGLGAYILKASDLRPGDLIFLGSVSGRTANIVDLAYEAKKMGIKVIAMSSMTYARAVDPVHSSGKKLYEMVDLTLDNCAPAAEGMMDVEGIEAPYAAASGIASAYILWSVTSVAIEELMARGITPGILKSANFPGGSEYNNTKMYPQYEEFGW